MAAMLIEIKSRMLLPPKKAHRRGGRGPARRAGAPPARVRAIKLAAAQLDELPLYRPRLPARAGHDRAVAGAALPDVNAVDLREAWAEVLQARQAARAPPHRPRAAVGARAHEHRAARLQGRRFVEFADLFDPARGVPVLVVHLHRAAGARARALLEVTQAEAFAPIYVRLAYEELVTLTYQAGAWRPLGYLLR
jgi:segregation and condensation protein A